MLLFTINLKNLIPGPFSSIPNTKNPKKEFVSIFVKNPSLRFFKKKYLNHFESLCCCNFMQKIRKVPRIKRNK